MRKTWIYVRALNPDGTARYQSKHISQDAAIISIHAMIEKASKEEASIVFEILYGLKRIEAGPVITAILANRSGDPEPDPIAALEAAIEA